MNANATEEKREYRAGETVHGVRLPHLSIEVREGEATDDRRNKHYSRSVFVYLIADRAVGPNSPSRRAADLFGGVGPNGYSIRPALIESLHKLWDVVKVSKVDIWYPKCDDDSWILGALQVELVVDKPSKIPGVEARDIVKRAVDEANLVDIAALDMLRYVEDVRLSKVGSEAPRISDWIERQAHDKVMRVLDIEARIEALRTEYLAAFHAFREAISLGLCPESFTGGESFDADAIKVAKKLAEEGGGRFPCSPRFPSIQGKMTADEARKRLAEIDGEEGDGEGE